MKFWNTLGLFLSITLSVSTSALAGGYSVSEAQNYQRRKDWDGLLRYGKSWSQAEPNNSNAWAMISVAYFFGMDRPDLALEPTKRAAALSPQEPGAWTALGNIYVKLKRYPEAVDAFKRSVDLAPNNGNHYNNLATAYSYVGDYPRALQTLEKQESVAGSTQNYILWYNLGNGYLNVYSPGMNGAATGSNNAAILNRARHAYEQTLRMNARYANAWNNLGTVQQAQGDAQSALNSYQRAAALGDSYGQSNYTNLQNAIAAAKAQAAMAARCGRPSVYVPGCPYVPDWVQARDAAIFRWNHSYHEPGDIRGRPW
jgi:tetratricopeptide (TPR) repeat protein